jgi:hypothetical protein
MDTMKINQTLDLSKPDEVRGREIMAAYGDRAAHVWRVVVLNDGAAANLSGAAASAEFLRSDGNTVLLTGSIDGNVASVTLSQEVYAVAGDVRAAFRLTTGDAKQTVIHCLIHVIRDASEDVTVPGAVIPSIGDVLAMVDNANTATSAANAAAGTATTAAGTATTAAGTATTAAGAANSAASAANAAAGTATSAAGTATSAAGTATSAASAATTAAGTATTAAGLAEDAADAANAAAAYATSVAGIHVKALYATLGALQAAHPTGAAGDHYAVGTASSNVVYIWDVNALAWVSIGTLKGDTGATGATGAAGRGISNIVAYFYESTSRTSPVGGTWVPTPPNVADGNYMFFRLRVTYTDATEYITYESCISGPDGPDGATGATGADGADGTNGADGQSAYAAAQAGGYSDTQAAFYADLGAVAGLAAVLAAI